MAWLAVFGLLLQLTAATACEIGAVPSVASSGPDHGAFPICHSHASDDDLGPAPAGGHIPTHQHSCPFCSVHGHPALAPASPATTATLHPLSIGTIDAPAPVALGISCFIVGAPSQGPPSRA